MPSTPSGKQYLDPSALLARLKLAPKQQVGDFGVGGGAFFALAAAALVGAKGVVWAVDVFKPALSSAMSRVKLAGYVNVKPVWSNLEVFRGAKMIPDQSLDAGLLINVLHQSKKHREILRECSRMLKPGAQLLIVEWDVTGFGFGPKQPDLVPQQYLEKVVSDLGLQVVERFEASRYHYGLMVMLPTHAPAATART